MDNTSSESQPEPFQDSSSEYHQSDEEHNPPRIPLDEPGTNGINNKKGKKRIRSTSTWRRNVIKRKKARGEEHVNWKNKIIPPRVTGPNCECKYKCFSKINDVQQHTILTQFCNIGDKHKQDIYLAGLISAETIKRRRVKTGQGTARSIAFHYKVMSILLLRFLEAFGLNFM